MPKFSICSPVTMDKDHPDNLRMPRYDMFLRCLNSIAGQTFTDFEWIIADDMSKPEVSNILDDYSERWAPRGVTIRVVRLPEKSGRIIARNAAFEAASGDWMCWLDADDEYALNYLEIMDEAIRLFPDFSVFNFNHLIFHYNNDVSVRKFINMQEWGDKPFRSGVVGAGSFIYKRSIFTELGGIPEKGLYDFAEKAFEEFPEIKPFYWNEAKQNYDTLGNPWGEDYYYFYKITRHYPSKYLNAAPYFVHSRWGHRWPEDPNYVVDPGAKPQWNKNNV